MKISLMKITLVCLLLSGVTILAQNRSEGASDGPISVNLGDVFKKGNIKIANADLSSLPSLPRGYYSIQAVPTDNGGLISESAAFSFSVTR